MKQEHIEMIQELLTEERKMDRLCLTSRRFAEFELEIIRACEKQMSEKSTSSWDFVCPNCTEYMDEPYKYCNECGQKIDWSEE